MSAKNRQSSGRATPKGTKNPEKKTKSRKSDLPLPSAPPRDDLPGKAGKHGQQQQRVSRPVTHNRGNR